MLHIDAHRPLIRSGIDYGGVRFHPIFSVSTQALPKMGCGSTARTAFLSAVRAVAGSTACGNSFDRRGKIVEMFAVVDGIVILEKRPTGGKIECEFVDNQLRHDINP